MPSNDMAPHDEAQWDPNRSAANPAIHTPGDTLHQVDQQDADLKVPQPSRPGMADRQYSTHIYTLGRQHVRPPTGGPQPLPAEALVTVRPSRRGIQRTVTDYSTSSGLTVNEITPPRAMADTVEAQGPGTYRVVAQDTSRQDSGVEKLDDAALEKIVTVGYAIKAIDTFPDRIANKEYLESLTKAYPLPEPTGPKWWNRLRHGVFSTYRRLWTLVLLGNLAALLYCIWLSTQDLNHISYSSAATAVATNLFVGTLMRHEHCVNFLFRLFCALPHWLPVSIRRLAAKIYCYGGIHSSCGISGLAWYIYFLALLALQVQKWTASLMVVASLAGVVVSLLTTMVITSHPYMRSKFHNQWELMHRFFGWSCIGMIWAQIILIACANASYYNNSIAHALIITPAFWFLIAITMLIVYPWLRLRRMTYSAEQLSSHAIRLWFNDSKRILPLTVGIRLSTSPMTETHAFATIPNADSAPGFSVLISNSGDWTKRIITNPPAYLWARGAYTIGVLRVAMLFKPIVIVATGSGIGPCLSFLQVHPDWPCRVVWSARFPEATYGRGVMESVYRADPNAVVIDTKRTGKPDLVGIVHAIYKELGAEAVAIISNPMATREVVFELESRNVPAFGAIFDS